MSASSNVNRFQKVLEESKHIVAIAGAGLSAASGIPTFRGAGGLWRSHDVVRLATPEAFKADPSLVWQIYHMRREKALQCHPNTAHIALATMSTPLFLSAMAAPDATFTLITQNIDGLSARALKEVYKTKDVPEDVSYFEMHGRLFDTVCTKCALAGTEEFVSKRAEEPTIPLKDLPRCRVCNQRPGLLRPAVVWFGETPHHLQEIQDIVDKADLAIVVGTSSVVYPAAAYASEVQDHGGQMAVFNIDRSEGDEDSDFLFLGPCEETLPQVLFGYAGKGS